MNTIIMRTLLKPDIYKLFQQIQKSQWFSALRLAEFQHERLIPLLMHAQQFVPYYQKNIPPFDAEKPSLEILAGVPILTRSLLQSNEQDLCDTKTGFKTKSRITSSGTTGMAARVWLDKATSNYAKALQIRSNYEWVGIGPFPKKVYLKCLIKKNPNFIRRLFQSLRRCWYFYLVNPADRCLYPDKELAAVINAIYQIKPDIIIGNSSLVKKVADFITSHNIKGIHPQSVISIAEILTSASKRTVEQALRCRVYNQYGMSEFGPIASECPHGNMHLNEERFIVEIVADGIRVPNGQIGEIVVTDLVNYGFPLIRYSTGDLGIISTHSCPCGRGLAVLEKVLGRMIDCIPTPCGKNILAKDLDSIFEVFSYNEVRQVQLYQPALDQIIVRFLPGPDISPEIIKKITATVQPYFKETGVTISAEICDNIPQARSGKLQFYLNAISEFSPCDSTISE